MYTALGQFSRLGETRSRFGIRFLSFVRFYINHVQNSGRNETEFDDREMSTVKKTRLTPRAGRAVRKKKSRRTRAIFKAIQLIRVRPGESCVGLLGSSYRENVGRPDSSGSAFFRRGRANQAACDDERRGPPRARIFPFFPPVPPCFRRQPVKHVGDGDERIIIIIVPSTTAFLRFSRRANRK